MIVTTPDGRRIPVEKPQVKIVQRSNLLPAEQRLAALRIVAEPPVMRFFFGRRETVGGDWGRAVVGAVQAERGSEL